MARWKYRGTADHTLSLKRYSGSKGWPFCTILQTSAERIPHWLQLRCCSDSYGHLWEQISPKILPRSFTFYTKIKIIYILRDKHHTQMRLQWNYSWHFRCEPSYYPKKNPTSYQMLCPWLAIELPGSLNEFNFMYFFSGSGEPCSKTWYPKFLGKVNSAQFHFQSIWVFFWWKAPPLKNLDQLCTSSTYRSITWIRSAILNSEDMYWAWQGNALILVGLCM